jgi:hypothetical protein
MTWVDDGIRKNGSKRKYRKMTMAIKQIVILYLIAINVATFFTYGIDKWKAKHGQWRISEATLLGLAVKAYKCEVIYDYNIINGMALKKPEDKSLEETMQHFRGVKGVVAVEYDHITRLTDPVKPRLETR